METVYSFNARSLVNKLSEFKCFVDSVKPGLVLVCETWFSDNLPDNLVCPADYAVFRKDRQSSVGGGVAIFVRKDLMAKSVNIKVNNVHDLEIVCVDVQFKSQYIRFITCYRPPAYSAHDVEYLKHLVCAISDLCLKASQVIIMGDFNLPNVDWDNYSAPNEPCYNLFMSFVNNNGLQQYVSEPTRFGNVLDLILTFNTYLISDVSVQCPFSTSDHNMIIVLLPLSPTVPMKSIVIMISRRLILIDLKISFLT